MDTAWSSQRKANMLSVYFLLITFARCSLGPLYDMDVMVLSFQSYFTSYNALKSRRYWWSYRVISNQNTTHFPSPSFQLFVDQIEERWFSSKKKKLRRDGGDMRIETKLMMSQRIISLATLQNWSTIWNHCFLSLKKLSHWLTSILTFTKIMDEN